MTPNDFLHIIEKQQAQIQKLVNNDLPIKVGRAAKDHFQENFTLGGYVNGGLHRWQPAKRLSSGKKNAASNYGTLLSGRNHLFDSINYKPGNGEVTIFNNVIYASVHNEGLRAGRGGGFIMPKRQFIGDSKELDDKTIRIIENELTNILKTD